MAPDGKGWSTQTHPRPASATQPPTFAGPLPGRAPARLAVLRRLLVADRLSGRRARWVVELQFVAASHAPKPLATRVCAPVDARLSRTLQAHDERRLAYTVRVNRVGPGATSTRLRTMFHASGGRRRRPARPTARRPSAHVPAGSRPHIGALVSCARPRSIAAAAPWSRGTHVPRERMGTRPKERQVSAACALRMPGSHEVRPRGTGWRLANGRDQRRGVGAPTCETRGGGDGEAARALTRVLQPGTPRVARVEGAGGGQVGVGGAGSACGSDRERQMVERGWSRRRTTRLLRRPRS